MLNWIIHSIRMWKVTLVVLVLAEIIDPVVACVVGMLAFVSVVCCIVCIPFSSSTERISRVQISIPRILRIPRVINPGNIFTRNVP